MVVKDKRMKGGKGKQGRRIRKAEKWKGIPVSPPCLNDLFVAQILRVSLLGEVNVVAGLPRAATAAAAAPQGLAVGRLRQRNNGPQQHNRRRQRRRRPQRDGPTHDRLFYLLFVKYCLSRSKREGTKKGGLLQKKGGSERESAN